MASVESTTNLAKDINYIYEFKFNDSYNDDVFNQYNNPSDELKIEIQKTANSLQNILKIKPGIRSISSFSYYLNDAYKVTVINTSWVQPVDTLPVV